MTTLKVRTFTGDKTGIFDVISGTRLYIDEGSFRMRVLVNNIVRKGGELILPQITEVAGHRAPSLQIYGAVYGVGQLVINGGSHVQLHRDGYTGCFGCSSKYIRSEFSRKYWFDEVIVKGGGKLEVVSGVQNVNSASQLNLKHIAVEYNGVVLVDAIDMFTKHAKIDYNARFDSSNRGWSAGRGTGVGGTQCGGSGGGGHGGFGGRGYSCSCNTYSSGRILKFQAIVYFII